LGLLQHRMHITAPTREPIERLPVQYVVCADSAPQRSIAAAPRWSSVQDQLDSVSVFAS
jgi:hypothetical protein